MKKSILLFFCMLLLPFAVRAATLGVVASQSNVAVGTPFRVDVALDTQGDSMNAVQGTISFPANLFTLQSVNDGNSMVTFWVEQPTQIASGVVEFSGIVPGGFEGAASSVVGLILDPIAEGTGTIAMSDIAVLRNDGTGSSIPVSSTVAAVSVGAASSNTLPLPPIVSFVVPESFMPTIAQDPNVYGGKYFLVFSTTDKGSGIDHYEVLEAPTGRLVLPASSWQRASSPYLLQDQGLTSDLYVRAVDHAGNALVVKVPAKYPASLGSNSYPEILVMAFLGILLVAGIVYLFKRRRMVR